MPGKRYQKSQIIVFVLALFAVLPEARSLPFGFVDHHQSSIRPSVITRDDVTGEIKSYDPDTEFSALLCYGLDYNRLLSCPYTVQLVGVDPGTDPLVTFNPPIFTLDAYGGHEHGFDTHPFYWVADPSDPPVFPHNPIEVLSGGPFTRPNSLTVQGSTDGQVNYLYFQAPEAAGSIWVNVSMQSPPNHNFYAPTWSLTEYRWHTTYVAEFKGLEALPLQGTDYVVVRTLETGHPDVNAAWGLPDTISALQRIAQNYHTLTARRLSVNDMSLPRGGLFDVNHDWAPPHKTHRDGTAFDVNQCDEGNVCAPCRRQKVLFKIASEIDDLPVESINANSTPVGILCEPGGIIHINVHNP